MLTIPLSQVQAPAYSGYKAKDGFLPKAMSWLEPEAAVSFRRMVGDSGGLIRFTDVYRSVVYQIQCIQRAPKEKRRLYAPPTKSGHNFGMSVDVALEETLDNFKKSGDSELVVAARNMDSFRRWMLVYGFTPIKNESWHFDYLGKYDTCVQKIEAVYGKALRPDNAAVQVALNTLVGKSLPAPLKVDGVLGLKSSEAAKIADKVLGTEDNGSIGAWFRRVLAGSAATIEEK